MLKFISVEFTLRSETLTVVILDLIGVQRFNTWKYTIYSPYMDLFRLFDQFIAGAIHHQPGNGFYSCLGFHVLANGLNGARTQVNLL